MGAKRPLWQILLLYLGLVGLLLAAGAIVNYLMFPTSTASQSLSTFGRSASKLPEPEPFPSGVKVLRPGEDLPATLGGGVVPDHVYTQRAAGIYRDFDLTELTCSVRDGTYLGLKAVVDRTTSMARLLVQFAECRGYMTVGDTSLRAAAVRSESAPTLNACAYLREATSVSSEFGAILTTAKGHVGRPAQLRRDAQQISQLLTRFGAKAPPTGMAELQRQMAGMLAAAEQMFEAWAAGDAGELEAEVMLRLTDSVTEEVRRLRAAYGCS